MDIVSDLFVGSPKGFEPKEVWQDREIRFDSGSADLEPRRGEAVVDILDNVEDTKGNNGDSGVLKVTNLRIIWVSKKLKRTNLSMGYGCITAIDVKNAASRLKGETQAMYILTKFHNQRFEFIFSNLSKAGDLMFSTVESVFHSYDMSRLYRDLKLRGAFIADKELKLLPKEQMYSRVNGIWNLSSEQGNLGTFFISNVRVVWYANLAENFNVSIPYVQIKSVRIRDSKFGQALVIETTACSGGYVLGFKIDPKETMDYVFKEISTLWQIHTEAPNFGVECEVSLLRQQQAATTDLSQLNDEALIDSSDKGDVLSQYYADATKGADREPVYCAELGLAIEQLKEGLSIEQLWGVL